MYNLPLIRPIAFSLFCLSSSLCVHASIFSHSEPKAVYRFDSRVEVIDYPDASIRDMATGVAGMVRSFRLLEREPRLRFPTVNDRNSDLELLIFDNNSSDIHKSIVSLIRSYEGDNSLQFPSTVSPEMEYFYFDQGRTMQRNMNICPNERFVEQPILPDCTGFLISEDLLVTAGHCVETAYQCSSFRWVFGFEKGVERIKRSDVYHCAEIVSHDLANSSFVTRDYSIIRLDRPVLDRDHLPIRLSGRLTVGSELAVIGHPTGLPMKIADNATVQNARINFFYSDLDTFSGNSGSPVIGVNTQQVEGILVEGEEDFEFVTNRRCYVPKRFNSSRDSGGREKVFRINRIPNIRRLID
jgi:hypothetical protein